MGELNDGRNFANLLSYEIICFCCYFAYVMMDILYFWHNLNERGWQVIGSEFDFIIKIDKSWRLVASP